jgi:hypothetical protein
MQSRLDGRIGGRGLRSSLRAAVGAVAISAIASVVGCASGRVSDLDAYDKIPMNKVVPYPSKQELRKRAYEIIVVDRPAVGIEESMLEKPRAQVRRALEGLATKAGAAVIDRSLQDIGGIRTEGVLGELEGREAEDVSGADYALATRFSNYRYTSTWKRPFKFLWQTPEDVANKPGTCTHKAEIEIDVQVIEIGSNDHVAKTFALKHSLDQKNKDLDKACTIAPVTLGVLFETVIDEAVGCLNIPLGTLLAPRGHLTQHRKAPGAERHIYEISLGSVHGIETGELIEIRREQRSMSPSGEETSSERVIALAEVTDQVMEQSSWIAADPTKASDTLLDGDVVRPRLAEGLLSSLSGPDCGDILD